MPFALLWTLVACQEPFDTDRHDLRDFRIAAVGVEDGVARAAIWSGLGPWHDAAPDLQWSLDDDFLGEGFDVAVPDEGTLVLDAISPDGQTRAAQVSISTEDAGPLSLTNRAAVTISDADLALDARRQLTAEDVAVSAPSGQAMRLNVSGLAQDAATRWMTAGGTILELEDDTADFFAEEIRFDDGEIEVREPISEGVFVGLALAIDGDGTNRWLWFDAAVGVDDQTILLHHDGRLLPADAAVEPGLVAATLEADDNSGVRLSNVEAVADTDQQDDLACMPQDATTFSVAWIAEGRCPRPDVIGARVVLAVQ